jgi:hypothetical protein
LSINIFAFRNTRGPLARVTAGTGLVLAAIATVSLGAGVAGADPQQPVLVDDAVPAPAPTGMDPSMAVNIANGLFGQLSSVLDNIFPGAGQLLMPAASAAAGGMTPGTGLPSIGGLPGTTPGLSTPGLSPGLTSPGLTPGLPGQTPGLSTPGLTPGLTSPGLTPGLPGQTPGLTTPGLTPGLTSPGLTPGLPGQTPGLTTPGLTPTLPGQAPGVSTPGLPGLTPGVTGPQQTAGLPGYPTALSPVDTSPVV